MSEKGSKNLELFDEGGSSRKGRGTRRRSKSAVSGRLKVHDPFELVRWLALSQPDPRKALAELVQNSLDAGASTVRVTRVREKKTPCLKILDDGEGVIPEMERPEALRYIATHIGHSRKRQLSPEERLELMTQGQYGIGLLGFWALGEALEMRSSVPGDKPHRLILYRDSPDYVIEPIRQRKLFDRCWTEVVVVGLHREAQRAVLGRRAADYLAAELRGQLLSREVDLVVEDKMARGRAEKIIPVVPQRFYGEPVDVVDRVEVPGQPPARLEIYLAAEERSGEHPIAVYAAGTLVAESFDELSVLGLDRSPWTDPRLTGAVDFPGFQVAPGSRRGVVPDQAAANFALAIEAVEPALERTLERLEERRVAELDRKLMRDLKRAFRGFYRRRTKYTFLPVADDGATGEGEDESGSGTGTEIETSTEVEEIEDEVVESTEPAHLLPPGPLAAVEITPQRVRVVREAARRVRARAVDSDGRAVAEPVSLQWVIDGELASVSAEEGSDRRALVRAGDTPGETTLRVFAEAGERHVLAEAVVEILAEPPTGGDDEGIPEPDLVEHPGASWRSRLSDGRWQINAAHPDYRAIAEKPKLKVRYLAMLFAKEVVLRSSQDPRLDDPLEELVEIAAYADRNLKGR